MEDESSEEDTEEPTVIDRFRSPPTKVQRAENSNNNPDNGVLIIAHAPLPEASPEATNLPGPARPSPHRKARHESPEVEVVLEKPITLVRPLAEIDLIDEDDGENEIQYIGENMKRYPSGEEDTEGEATHIIVYDDDQSDYESANIETEDSPRYYMAEARVEPSSSPEGESTSPSAVNMENEIDRHVLRRSNNYDDPAVLAEAMAETEDDDESEPTQSPQPQRRTTGRIRKSVEHYQAPGPSSSGKT